MIDLKVQDTAPFQYLLSWRRSYEGEEINVACVDSSYQGRSRNRWLLKSLFLSSNSPLATRGPAACGGMVDYDRELEDLDLATVI